MPLRDYQQRAVDSVWDDLEQHDEGNPLVVLPTGAGKTHVIAALARKTVEFGGRAIVLAHVRELLEQTASRLAEADPDLAFGVYSAGLGRRDVGYDVTIAGIQSVWQKAHEFGPLDLVIVDECHMIQPEGDGMYRSFLSDAMDLCDHQRVVGLTATPYRLGHGMICGPPGKSIFQRICCEVGVGELMEAGWLCEVKPYEGAVVANTEGVRIRAGEFVQDEIDELVIDMAEAAVADIVQATWDRRSVLVFCASIAHAEKVVAAFASHGIECGFVHGETPRAERDRLTGAFRRCEAKYLANVGVLTTGFDAPCIDCVVLLRPTASPGLYYQMVGRGFRTCEGKDCCVVLDYSGNVVRHGPVDAIRVRDRSEVRGEAPAKACPKCSLLIATGFRTCPGCGFEFPEPEVGHGCKASTAALLSRDERVGRETLPVDEVVWRRHMKRGDPQARPTLRVEYRCGLETFKEWVCIEHTGYARQVAEEWWAKRCMEPCPRTVADAIAYWGAGAVAETLEITVERKPDSDWWQVMRNKHRLDEVPRRGAAVAEEIETPW